MNNPCGSEERELLIAKEKLDTQKMNPLGWDRNGEKYKNELERLIKLVEEKKKILADCIKGKDIK